MQAFVNFLAVTSFIVSGAVVGAGAYVYVNKDSLIEQAKEYALSQLPIPEIPVLLEDSLPGATSIPIPTLPF
tara:strand:- start:143 stop:358 length:216 start_codon:yes stop_codon:yes gene_type:complete